MIIIVLDEYFDIDVTGKRWNFYRNKGYTLNNNTNIIKVKNEDLPTRSEVMERRQCDICGKIVSRKHARWLATFDSFGKDLCVECSRKQNLEKVKKTNLEKYGCEFPMQSKTIKEKAKQTCLKNYNCEYSFQNKQVREFAQGKMLEKFGSYSEMASNENVKNKRKKTNLKKYGTENVFQSEVIKEKTKKTLKDKYNVEYISQDANIQEKIKETNLKKYGVERPLQNKEILNKARNTCFDRYGFYSANQSEEIRDKTLNTLTKNNNVPTSTQQTKIFEMIKDAYPNNEIYLNYKVSLMIFDILIIFDNVKIDIEYDGEFWHQDEQKDRKRDEYSKKLGYKILRIRSKRLIPDIDNIKQAINELITTDRTFKLIKLSDCKN